MNAVLVAPLDWEVVRDCHHEYTGADCGAGHLCDGVFTGEVGRYRWQATVKIGIPYCSACDEPLDAGLCSGCRLVHADVVPLTETRGDPLRKDAA